jgi:hypothetical protein
MKKKGGEFGNTIGSSSIYRVAYEPDTIFEHLELWGLTFEHKQLEEHHLA